MEGVKLELELELELSWSLEERKRVMPDFTFGFLARMHSEIIFCYIFILNKN